MMRSWGWMRAVKVAKLAVDPELGSCGRGMSRDRGKAETKEELTKAGR